MFTKRSMTALSLLVLVALGLGLTRRATVWMGRQPDGAFMVSSGQRVEGGSIAFNGRPIDLAVHPREDLFAVLNKSEVFLADEAGVRRGTNVTLGEKASAGFRGLAWSPDGARLFASTDEGFVQVFGYEQGRLTAKQKLRVKPEGTKGNPVPGGMAITRDGTRLFVAAANRNAVAEINLTTLGFVREYPVRNSAVRAEALGGRTDADRQQLGWPATEGPATGRPRARTSTSWSMSEGRRRRERSA